MYVDKILKARLPDYTNDVLAKGHRYKHIVTSRLELAIDVEDLRVLTLDV